MVVADAVRGPLGIQHFEIEDAIHGHLDVVASDADLFGNVDGGFLQRMPVSNGVQKR